MAQSIDANSIYLLPPILSATASVGYIFKVCKNSYIEPWGAVHYVLNDENIVVVNSKYEPEQFKAEVSLKIGWVFKLKVFNVKTYLL